MFYKVPWNWISTKGDWETEEWKEYSQFYWLVICPALNYRWPFLHELSVYFIKEKKKLNCIHDSLFITLILPERLNKEMKEYKIWNVASVSLKSDE